MIWRFFFNRNLTFSTDFDFALNETSWSAEGSSELANVEHLIEGAFAFIAVRSFKIENCVAIISQGGPIQEPPIHEPPSIGRTFQK